MILTGDWHIRSDTPRCRKDEDWENTQRLAVREIVNITNKYNDILCIVGDVFDTPNVPSRMVKMLIDELSNINKSVYFIAGNHDLPFHSIENMNNSSIGIFISMSENHSKIKHGMDFELWSDFNCDIQGKGKNVLFLHQLVFENAKFIPPNCTGTTAKELLEKYDAKYIIVGDNHKAFVYENNGRYVINPGCIIRQSSDEKEYKPSVYYLNMDKKNKIERIYISDNVELVDDSYIKEENERENRIEAFVEGVKKNGKVSLDFISNLNNAMNKNKLNKETVSMIDELLEEESK